MATRISWSYEKIVSFSEDALIYMWHQCKHENWIDRGETIVSISETEKSRKAALKMWGK